MTTNQQKRIAPSFLWSLFHSIRPFSFLVSLNTICLGGCLAYRALGAFDVPIFLLTIACTLSVHAAANLVNTYVDYVKGVDDSRSSDKTLVDGTLKPDTVADFIAVLYFLACVLFGSLAYASPAPLFKLLPIFCVAVCASGFYTAVIGLKYVALGDVTVMTMFGPAVVIMTYTAQGGLSILTPVLYCIPLILLTEGVLHANNTRDLDSDASKGILTVAILLGKTGSSRLFTFLLFAPYFVSVFQAAWLSVWFSLPLATVFAAMGVERGFNGGRMDDGPACVAQLSFKFAVFYIAACLLADQSAFSNLV